MVETNKLVRTVFSGLAALVIEDVEDAGEVIVVRASTRGEAVECPACGTPTRRVHAFCERRPADVPVDGRRVLVRVRVRRMRCPVTGCARRTFREQVPGLLERYQRRTVRLREQVRAVVRELAGRASARLLPVVGIGAGRDTALRTLMGIALPERAVPTVLGIDDFALRRSHTYATVMIDATTGARIDVIPGRGAQPVTDWLREHPGVQTVCRDGSTAYAQAVRDALPGAVQVSDRWHLWHGLGEAVAKEVAAHSTCWASATGLQDGPRAATTAERWTQVHGLLEQGVGLLDCARRLNLSLNTVKRYARASAPERLQRVPTYRSTLVDPYRDHLRSRRAAEPGVAVQQLLREIRELGYQGSANLLYRYLNQGRAEDDRAHLSPRRAARLLLTRPDKLTTSQQERLGQLAGACPQITAALSLVGAFAALLKPDQSNAAALQAWAAAARAADLPHVHSFVRGIEQDRDAVIAAITTTHHNGRTEGVNTRTKMLKRQMYGRAGFALLRHRILLG
ncbi:Transposase [Raineyella antarctica]|uniref:Transposase n=1 Tax=Raineyella antarctica TaxID=1577474 RepID=A0A1G6GEK0_9ACTN|nr:Transposase [Raineyella antarctica]